MRALHRRLGKESGRNESVQFHRSISQNNATGVNDRIDTWRGKRRGLGRVGGRSRTIQHTPHGQSVEAGAATFLHIPPGRCHSAITGTPTWPKMSCHYPRPHLYLTRSKSLYPQPKKEVHRQERLRLKQSVSRSPNIVIKAFPVRLHNHFLFLKHQSPTQHTQPWKKTFIHDLRNATRGMRKGDRARPQSEARGPEKLASGLVGVR